MESDWTTNEIAKGSSVASVDVRIVPAGSDRDAYLPLLLLADESIEQVSAYYQTGDLYVIDAEDGTPMAMTLAIPEPDGSVELKAVAVDASLHGQGVGKRMLAGVLADLKAKGVRHVIVGTANAGIGQLAFYQKAGFRLWKIERDFFGTDKGYPEGMEENVILLIDMLWMDLEFS